MNINVNIERGDIIKALKCLEDNGIERCESPIVLQALCYILLDTEIDGFLTDEDYE